MKQGDGRLRRQIIVAVLIKIGLLALLWFVFAQGVLMKKAGADAMRRHLAAAPVHFALEYSLPPPFPKTL
jgi:hypothetical protein